ncbi:CheB methylesterase domain-containing protein [Gemmobacter denitrificans]|uniref:protein-glutamate methylesterase n=1 Tax=Gemmobacter denitrificans TaxID=3123040 RepID=A0ABU8BSD3_9RHOB
MSQDTARNQIAIVVDPDSLRLRRVAGALAPLRVIGAMSLFEAFSLVEEAQPVSLAISDTAAAEPGFDMFLRLIKAIGARWVVYGAQPPAQLPPNTAWVDFGRDDNPAVVADVLAGRTRPKPPPSTTAHKPELILIGASTGGIAAIETVLSQFTTECPPTLIVQHIRPNFLDGLLDRLNRCCTPHVVAAQDNAIPTRGTVHIAATADCHLVLTGTARPRMAIVPAPATCPHRPSVDALFQSAAAFGPKVAAALLTGMGADGARGLGEIRAAGGFTIAQNRETCTVYGMPRIAAEMGAASAILPLDRIGAALLAGAAQSVPAQASLRGPR